MDGAQLYYVRLQIAIHSFPIITNSYSILSGDIFFYTFFCSALDICRMQWFTRLAR